MQNKKLINWLGVSLLATVAGCASVSSAPPVCPKPTPLPAWVIEAANGPSLGDQLRSIFSDSNPQSEPLKKP